MLQFFIIMQTDNQANFIHRVIGSLINKPYPSRKLILVNDGCTDRNEIYPWDMGKLSNTFVTYLNLLAVKYTQSFSDQYINEHPYKYNLFGLSKRLVDYCIDIFSANFLYCSFYFSIIFTDFANMFQASKQLLCVDEIFDSTGCFKLHRLLCFIRAVEHSHSGRMPKTIIGVGVRVAQSVQPPD